jgi:hypothetical protein
MERLPFQPIHSTITWFWPVDNGVKAATYQGLEKPAIMVYNEAARC